MGYHVGLQHIAILHINRRGGIWLYLFLARKRSYQGGSGRSYDTSTLYSGLDALCLKDEAFAFAPFV